MAKLVTGPTTAIRNSARGLGGSSSRCETPPNTCRVIPRTESPCAIATSEWDSSWSNTETKRRNAASSPLAQWAAAGRSGSTRGKYPIARVHVMSP
jgi:hypothetical protein